MVTAFAILAMFTFHLNHNLCRVAKPVGSPFNSSQLWCKSTLAANTIIILWLAIRTPGEFIFVLEKEMRWGAPWIQIQIHVGCPLMPRLQGEMSAKYQPRFPARPRPLPEQSWQTSVYVTPVVSSQLHKRPFARTPLLPLAFSATPPPGYATSCSPNKAPSSICCNVFICLTFLLTVFLPPHILCCKKIK